MTRNRSRSSDPISGTYQRFGATYYQSATRQLDGCSDEVLSGDGLPLYISHYNAYGGGILTSSGTQTFFARWPTNWPVYALATQYFRRHLSISSPSDYDCAATVLARTNPSKPEVSVPVFIGELRDLPNMLRLHGRSMLEKTAAANLLFRFGWKPLLSDMASMLYFTELTNKRLNMLKRIKREGLGRRCQLGTYVNTHTEDAVVESVASFVTRTYSAQTAEKVWGYVEYSPTVDFPSSEADMTALARKAVFGLGLTKSDVLSDLWELLPWSWFIDYFSNIGDYLEANRNIVPVTSSLVQIMRHTATEWLDTNNEIAIGVGGNPWISYTPFNVAYETKSRSAVSPLISAHMPFLNEGQVSILGSLAILKGR